MLAAGLTAIGIPAHEAIPAVLLFRVATFWLPIPQAGLPICCCSSAASFSSFLISRLSREGPMSITRLTAGSCVTRQAITKHLRVIERASLARSIRQGRERVWQLQPQRLEEARRYLDVISRQWDDALARLRHFLENDG